MSHPIHRVRGVDVVGPYALHVEFDDGTSQTIDLEPVLAGALYGPLRDPAVFSQVRIDPEVQTLVWPNGADFDPATLHDWPTYREAFARRAREWASEGGKAGCRTWERQSSEVTKASHRVSLALPRRPTGDLPRPGALRYP